LWIAFIGYTSVCVMTLSQLFAIARSDVAEPPPDLAPSA
jgi:hypothetical protein